MRFIGAILLGIGAVMLVAFGILGKVPGLFGGGSGTTGDVSLGDPIRTTAGGGSQAGSVSLGPPVAETSAGVWPARLFGLGRTVYQRFEYGYLGVDSASVPGAVREANYGLAQGTRALLVLPGQSSARYTLLDKRTLPGVGGLELWRTPNGGLMMFLHLSELVANAVGTSLPGGAFAGRSGWPLDPAYGNGVAGPANAHLAVVADSRGKAWLDQLSRIGG